MITTLLSAAPRAALQSGTAGTIEFLAGLVVAGTMIVGMVWFLTRHLTG